MADLTKLLTAACDAFNDARNTLNYSALKPYLAQHVVMHRVDDATSVEGSPDDIINYLNHSQAKTGKFPQLQYGHFPAPKSSSPQNITGTADYIDRIDKTVTPIPVFYNFHFTTDNLIDVAIALPT